MMTTGNTEYDCLVQKLRSVVHENYVYCDDTLVTMQRKDNTLYNVLSHRSHYSN